MRTIREFEFLLGAGLLLGPMVYALTLPKGLQQCEVPAPVVVEAHECAAAEVEPAPIEPPQAEAIPVEPAAVVEPSPAEPREFMFVVDGRFVVIADDVSPRFGMGELFEPLGKTEHRAAKQADPERVPASMWAEGRAIDLYGADGKVCSAKIDRLLVLAQYGWGTEDLGLDSWDDEKGEPIEHHPARVRRAVWNTQPHWLVGELDADCAAALWARDASLPAPTILTKSEDPSATTRVRLAMFEQSNAVADLRKEYEAYREANDELSLEHWNVRMADQAPSVSAWIDPAGDPRFIELQYGFDDASCGDGYDTELTAFEAVRDGAFVPFDESVDVDAIFDADLDGRFERLRTSERGLTVWLTSETKAFDASIDIDQDFFCPC